MVNFKFIKMVFQKSMLLLMIAVTFGCSSSSSTTSIPTPAMEELSITVGKGRSETHIDVQWKNPSTDTTFLATITRTDSSGTSVTVTSDLTVSTYQDSNVSSNVSYDYSVNLNTDSSTVSYVGGPETGFLRPTTTMLPTPASVSALTESTYDIAFSWEPVVSEGTDDIHYNIYHVVDGESQFVESTTEPSYEANLMHLNAASLSTSAANTDETFLVEAISTMGISGVLSVQVTPAASRETSSQTTIQSEASFETLDSFELTVTDSDNDGVVDSLDAFPNDASETTDTDSDGVGDNADAFPNDATQQTDTDSGSNSISISEILESSLASNIDRQITVAGLSIYAVTTVPKEKLIHAAHILAQYLDNDEDGIADNRAVLRKLQELNAAVIMWDTDPDTDFNFDELMPIFANPFVVDLGAIETQPDWHTNGNLVINSLNRGGFDAALEEIFHLVSYGYILEYPSTFGVPMVSDFSELTSAMDLARGGQIIQSEEEDPWPEYSDDAWFTYYDETCDYNCMAIEYFYWAMTSLLGAHENRFDIISEEWTLNTPELVQTRDPAIYSLLTDPEYAFPTVLPDGTYRQ